MDHAHANIIEFSDEPATAKMVYSDFSKQDKNETLQRGEGEMHQKEQHQTLKYYKTLSAIIRDYDEVVLFGPTDAKTELFNYLRNHPIYDKIKIKAINSDKLTDAQQHAFVRKFFKPIPFISL